MLLAIPIYGLTGQPLDDLGRSRSTASLGPRDAGWGGHLGNALPRPWPEGSSDRVCPTGYLAREPAAPIVLIYGLSTLS